MVITYESFVEDSIGIKGLNDTTLEMCNICLREAEESGDSEKKKSFIQKAIGFLKTILGKIRKFFTEIISKIRGKKQEAEKKEEEVKEKSKNSKASKTNKDETKENKKSSSSENDSNMSFDKDHNANITIDITGFTLDEDISKEVNDKYTKPLISVLDRLEATLSNTDTFVSKFDEIAKSVEERLNGKDIVSKIIEDHTIPQGKKTMSVSDFLSMTGSQHVWRNMEVTIGWDQQACEKKINGLIGRLETLSKLDEVYLTKEVLVTCNKAIQLMNRAMNDLTSTYTFYIQKAIESSNNVNKFVMKF